MALLQGVKPAHGKFTLRPKLRFRKTGGIAGAQDRVAEPAATETARLTANSRLKHPFCHPEPPIIGPESAPSGDPACRDKFARRARCARRCAVETCCDAWNWLLGQTDASDPCVPIPGSNGSAANQVDISQTPRAGL